MDNLEKGIKAALADELLHTVIHKFQIPGSGVQLEVQETAIKKLMLLLEERGAGHFPIEVWDLVGTVKKEMPACFGMVPSCFYELRKGVEEVLSKDEFLRHVVATQSIRGTQSDLDYLVPILKNPDIPESVKESFLEGGIMLVLDMDILNSVAVIIDELGGEKATSMKAFIASGAFAAEQGSHLTEALTDALRTEAFEKLRSLEVDFNQMIEATARADRVLDGLYRHYRGKFYDKKE